MAEQNKTQMGDGADNYGQAAGQMAKAAKQLGQKAAKQAAAKGVEATANAATAAVQASGRWKGCSPDCSRYCYGRPLGSYFVFSMVPAAHSL